MRSLETVIAAITPLDGDAQERARQRQRELTKPA